MNLDLNFNGKTKLEDWWGQIKSILGTVQDDFNNEVSAREGADTTLQTNIDTKVDKVDGKDLSTNDYTNDEKTKLAKIGYGTCTSSASTYRKIVSCDGFKREAGSRVVVSFTNGNTSNYFTLNVNSTGNYYVYFPINGTLVYNDDFIKEIIVPNTPYEFVFVNSRWVYTGNIITNKLADGAVTIDSLSDEVIQKFSNDAVTGETLNYWEYIKDNSPTASAEVQDIGNNEYWVYVKTQSADNGSPWNVIEDAPKGNGTSLSADSDTMIYCINGDSYDNFYDYVTGEKTYFSEGDTVVFCCNSGKAYVLPTGILSFVYATAAAKRGF